MKIKQWNPIDTAPKDGTPLLLFIGPGNMDQGFQVVGKWVENEVRRWNKDTTERWARWVDIYEGEVLREPDWWMFLPESPIE